MTIFRHATFLSLLLLLFYKDVKSQDVTDDTRNGCGWQGGSISRLLCNCESDAEMILNSDSISTFATTEIIVNGCRRLRIQENVITGLRNLRIITLDSIQSIYFESNSINWYGYRENALQTIEEERFDVSVPSLRLNVYNSNISEISSHAFAGRISEITFENVVMEKIFPLAFVNLLQTEKIIIKNSVLLDVGVQSFKKFSTENLELVNVTANLIPSRAFSNITVYRNVILDNCNFDTVRSGGFTIYNPKIFRVTNTNINHLNGEAFKIISRGIILFRNNTFRNVDNGAFRGIVLRRDVVLGDSRFIFDSNRIHTLNPNSLSMSESSVQFRNIILNEPCDCTALDNRIKDSSYYDEIMCMYDNQLITLNNFKSNMCSLISNYYVIIIIVCVVVTLIVAISIGLFMYYNFVYKRQKYGDKKEKKTGNMSLIVPDGRTYRETELHVIVERTDLLTTDL